MNLRIWVLVVAGLILAPGLLRGDLDDPVEKKPPAKNSNAITPAVPPPPSKDEKVQDILDLDKPANEDQKRDNTPKDTAPKSSPGDKKTPPNLNPNQTPGSEHDSKAPIQWKAKGFKGTRNGQQIELKEEVVVTQGNMTLLADRAKIFFNPRNEVDKVEAQGNVKVSKFAALEKDRITARGNEAVFFNAERKVTLKGKASIVRGGDVVRGKQITYDLDSGWISVDKVEGLVQPNEKRK